MPTKQTGSIAVFHLVGKDRLRERWSWFVGLGIVQLLFGAIAFGLLLYGRVYLLMGTSLLHGWLLPVLWVMNLLISIHMIFNGGSLVLFGLAAKNQSADVQPSLPDPGNLECFQQCDVPDCVLHSQSDHSREKVPGIL